MSQQALTKKRAEALPAPVLHGLELTMPSAYRLLPADTLPERYRAAVWLHLAGNKRLQECTPASILDCCIKAAGEGLMPGIDCYFLPFKGKASYVRHYQGLIRMLERTGKLRRAFAHPVYTGDQFSADYFQDRPTHVPYTVLGTAPGALRFYYGAIILKDGTCHFQVVSLDYIESVRKNAPGGEQEAWIRHPVEMGRKTALKCTCKYVALTPELQAMLDEEDTPPPAPPTTEQAQATIAELWGDATPARHAPQEELPDDGWRGELRALLPKLEGHALHAEASKALEDPAVPPGQGSHLLGVALDILNEGDVA